MRRGGEEGLRYDFVLLLFQLFFSDAVFEMLAVSTNAYAAFKGAGEIGHCLWRDTTAAELKTWIGMIIYIGVMKQGPSCGHVPTVRKTLRHQIIEGERRD